MRTPNTEVSKFSSTVSKMVMALVFASMIGGISVAPAFGKDNGGHGGHNGRGHYGHSRHAYQPTPRYYYSAPVYAPPPVVYVPEVYQSPGISLVFPIHIR